MPSIFARLFGRTRQPAAAHAPAVAKPSCRSSTGDSERKRRNAALAAARENIHTCVRDAMTASSILSSAYRFKVLVTSTEGDPHFAVLVNLDEEQPEGVGQHLFTESLIKRLAANRFQLAVDVVYWHVQRARNKKHARAVASLNAPRSQAPASAAAASARPANPLLQSSAPTGFEETLGRLPAASDSDFAPLGATQYGEP